MNRDTIIRNICQIAIKLLNQKNIQAESASALRELLDTSTDCLTALTNLGIDISSWDVIVVHILSLKLDIDSRKAWEMNVTGSVDTEELPSFEQFQQFLTSRFRALEFLEPNLSYISNKSIIEPKAMHVTTISCLYCNEYHKLGKCKQFSKQNVDTCRKFLESNKLCFNCLAQNHIAKYCRNSARCRICKRRHHSLLHTKTKCKETDINVKSHRSNKNNIVLK